MISRIAQGRRQRPNASMRRPQPGLEQLRCGAGKVKCVMLLFALAHNLMRMAALAPDLLGIGTGTSAIHGMGT
jgi:hypothetical protein